MGQVVDAKLVVVFPVSNPPTGLTKCRLETRAIKKFEELLGWK